jgi:indole-3-glycerol phosphate synthase
VKVSESGLNNTDDVQKLKKFGFEAFLMGEAFMKTANPAIACAQFIKDAELIKAGCL